MKRIVVLCIFLVFSTPTFSGGGGAGTGKAIAALIKGILNQLPKIVKLFTGNKKDQDEASKRQ